MSVLEISYYCGLLCNHVQINCSGVRPRVKFISRTESACLNVDSFITEVKYSAKRLYEHTAQALYEPVECSYHSANLFVQQNLLSYNPHVTKIVFSFDFSNHTICSPHLPHLCIRYLVTLKVLGAELVFLHF